MNDFNESISLDFFDSLDSEAQDNLLKQVEKALYILAARVDEWVPTAIDEVNPDEAINISFSILFADILPGSKVEEFYANNDLIEIRNKILAEMEDL